MACDCSDLEDKICTLSEELAAAEGCAGVVTRDADGGSHDHSGKITMKRRSQNVHESVQRKAAARPRNCLSSCNTACVRAVNC